MPRTGCKQHAALAIELDGGMSTHLHGDVLTGYVVIGRTATCQLPLYTSPIQLKLFGRVKTKYKVKKHSSTRIYRGRAVLFEQIITLSTNSGQSAWPFSFTIPYSSQSGFARRGDGFTASDGFLHTERDDGKEIDVTKHGLPPTLYYSYERLGSQIVEAYVEYSLVATQENRTASYPIYVRQRSTASPITSFNMGTHKMPNVVKSLKLLPGNADKELTFGETCSSFFRPGKLPRYRYCVNVEYPKIIQLEHPGPLPFKISVDPDLDSAQTTISPGNDINTLPPVQIESVEIALRGEFTIRCPGTFWDADKTKNHTFPFPLPWMLRTPITIPVVRRVTAADRIQNPTSFLIDPQEQPPSYEAPALDLGAHFKMLFDSSAASTCGQRAVPFKRHVYPTLATYNVLLKYRLEWKIFMLCVGEKSSICGKFDVVVLAPSEEQEIQKTREMGTDGMNENYDDLQSGVGAGIELVGGVLQAFG